MPILPACKRAQEYRRRPAADQFNISECEWFSKNTYNWSIKYCAEMRPSSLVRLLNTCIDFIKLLQEYGPSEGETDLFLRLMFCEFLATCTYTTLARAEDNLQECVSEEYGHSLLLD